MNPTGGDVIKAAMIVLIFCAFVALFVWGTWSVTRERADHAANP